MPSFNFQSGIVFWELVTTDRFFLNNGAVLYITVHLKNYVFHQTILLVYLRKTAYRVSLSNKTELSNKRTPSQLRWEDSPFLLDFVLIFKILDATHRVKNLNDNLFLFCIQFISMYFIHLDSLFTWQCQWCWSFTFNWLWISW